MLIPVAGAGLAGTLPLWGLVVAAFVLEAATSYFAPAYGALVPALVDRENVQQANALVRASAQALSIGGWALSAALLFVLPLSVFFAVNAVSFLLSALLIRGIRHGSAAGPASEEPHVREGFAALRPRPALSAGVVVPAGIVLARRPVRRKARASLLAWTAYLPGYGLMALTGSLGGAVAGAFAAGMGQSSAVVLLNSAAQEEVPDRLLGRILGLISFVHRGAHSTGLLFLSSLFAFADPPTVFAAAAVVLPLVGLAVMARATRAMMPR